MTYRKFYGFSDDPFAINPDPKFLYLAISHYQALSSMLAAVKERKGLMVMTGEVGVGKTLLVYALLKDLSEKIKTAFIFNPKLDFLNLLRTILKDLDVSFGGQEDLQALLVRFKRYLQERMARDEVVTIIIDEAQTLEDEVLEDLVRYLSPEASTAGAIQLLLVGQPELEAKLNSARLRPIKERIAVHDRIAPLTREEGRKYIKHRLKLAGQGDSEIFTADAVTQVWKFSQGIPRVMNVVCDRALLIGFGESSPSVDSRMVNEAIKELSYLQPSAPAAPPPPGRAREKSPRRISYLVPGILLLLLLGGAALSFHYRDSLPPAWNAWNRIFPPENRSSAKAVEKDKEARREPPAERPAKGGEKTSPAKKEPLPAERPGQEREKTGPEKKEAPPAEQPGQGREKTGPEKKEAPPAERSAKGEEIARLAKKEPPAAKQPEKEKKEASLVPPPGALPSGQPAQAKERAEILTVKEGWTLTSISLQHYPALNFTLLDYILEANPEVTNVHRIFIGQEIRVPHLTEGSLLFASSDKGFRLRLGTFADPQEAGLFKEESSLRGKTLETVPRRVSPQETWYRVEAAGFKSKEEALNSLQALKKRKLLPLLECLPRKTS